MDSTSYEQISDKGFWKVLRVTRTNPKQGVELSLEYACSNLSKYYYSANESVADGLAEYLNDLEMKATGAV